MKSLRIGTRGSPLALKQTEIFISQLKTIGVHNVVVVPIKTTGDIIVDRPLYDIGGKALFSREIEQALKRSEIDCAVHSLKDLEGTMSLNMLPVFLERSDPRDCLISRHNLKLADLPPGAHIGTSSPRREAQLKRWRPDLTITSIRGNVETRLKAIEEGRFDGTLLAVAGLKRLNFMNYISEIFEPDIMLPATGQGVIAIQAQPHHHHLIDLLKPLNHLSTQNCVWAERTLLHAINGDCRTPVAAYATNHDNVIRLRAQLWRDGQFISVEHTGIDPIQVGHDTAKLLLD